MRAFGGVVACRFRDVGIAVVVVVVGTPTGSVVAIGVIKCDIFHRRISFGSKRLRKNFKKIISGEWPFGGSPKGAQRRWGCCGGCECRTLEAEAKAVLYLYLYCVCHLSIQVDYEEKGRKKKHRWRCVTGVSTERNRL